MRIGLGKRIAGVAFTTLVFAPATFALGSQNRFLDGKYFDFYLGVNYTFWNMNYSLSDSVANAVGDSSARRYDTKVDPYILKVIDVKFKNLWGFELGLNYLSQSVFESLSFTPPQDVTTKEERVARQIELYVNRHITDNFKIIADAKLRKFQGTVTVLNIDSSAGSNVINYYGDGGLTRQLRSGDQIAWSTGAEELALLGYFTDGHEKSWINFYFGYRKFTHRAPAEISFDSAQNSSGPSVFFDALMLTDIHIHTAEAGLEINAFSEAGNGLSFNIPVNLGSYHYSNEYFSSPGAFITMIPFDISAIYGGSNWKFVLGFHYTYMFSVAQNTDITMDKRLTYQVNGVNRSIPEGAAVRIFSLRSETFWGPYFSFSMSF